jgi:hypothetical protein
MSCFRHVAKPQPCPSGRLASVVSIDEIHLILLCIQQVSDALGSQFESSSDANTCDLEHKYE